MSTARRLRLELGSGCRRWSAKSGKMKRHAGRARGNRLEALERRQREETKPNRLTLTRTVTRSLHVLFFYATRGIESWENRMYARESRDNNTTTTVAEQSKGEGKGKRRSNIAAVND